MKQKSTQKKTLHSQNITDICQRRHHPFFASSSFINLTNLSIEHPLYALDTPIRQCLVQKIRPQGGKRIDFCSGFLCLSDPPWPEGRRHTR
jgi:hypothetical protein